MFSRCVHENLEGYDSQGTEQVYLYLYLYVFLFSSYCVVFHVGASPVLIDEFVEQMYRFGTKEKEKANTVNNR